MNTLFDGLIILGDNIILLIGKGKRNMLIIIIVVALAVAVILRLARKNNTFIVFYTSMIHGRFL